MYRIYGEHPDWEYTCLVRTQGKADAVRRAFPKAKIVIGDLDAAELLEREAAKADIVLREDPNRPVTMVAATRICNSKLKSVI